MRCSNYRALEEEVTSHTGQEGSLPWSGDAAGAQIISIYYIFLSPYKTSLFPKDGPN